MAYGLTWSERGLSELQATVDYVAIDAPANAKSIARQAFVKANNLRDQPRSGRRLPENDTPREIREVFVYRWRLIYEVTENHITILAVHPGAMPIENAQPL